MLCQAQILVGCALPLLLIRVGPLDTGIRIEPLEVTKPDQCAALVEQLEQPLGWFDGDEDGIGVDVDGGDAVDGGDLGLGSNVIRISGNCNPAWS